MKLNLHIDNRMTIFDSCVSDEYLVRVVEVQSESDNDHSIAFDSRSCGSIRMGPLLGSPHPGVDGHGSMVWARAVDHDSFPNGLGCKLGDDAILQPQVAHESQNRG